MIAIEHVKEFTYKQEGWENVSRYEVGKNREECLSGKWFYDEDNQLYNDQFWPLFNSWWDDELPAL